MSAGRYSPACIFCGCDQLAAPEGDETIGIGSPIICGKCGGLMVVDLHEDCGGAIVRRPYAHERDELRERPAVKTFLDAYHLDQFEARVSVAADKPKIKDAMGGTMRLRSGETIRFTGKGPDAR